jgi:hypothetical protein
MCCVCGVGDRSLMREAVEDAEDESGVSQDLGSVRAEQKTHRWPLFRKDAMLECEYMGELTLTPCDVDMIGNRPEGRRSLGGRSRSCAGGRCMYLSQN